MITSASNTLPTSMPNGPRTSPELATQPSRNNTEHAPRQKSPKRKHHHQTLIPGLPYNPGVDKYIAKATEGFKTPSQSTAEIIKAELKTRWGKDIDPDNTFIVTLNYDPKQPKPRGGKVLNKISLTKAALHNVQRANKKDEHQTESEKQRSTLHTWLNRMAPLNPLSVLENKIDPLAQPQKTYEGIFVGAAPGQREVYGATNLLHETPAAFREIVWNTERSKPYTDFLNSFWPAHQSKYEQMSKASLVGAALRQFENNSLKASDTDLVMRAAGLPSNTTWERLKLDDLAPATRKDPDVEVGLLSINGFKSTDLLYITDKKPQLGDDGTPINRTLLYIPGNSSPIHTFDSHARMKTWLAEQAVDPVKREALSMHFRLRDQADRFFSEGVNQTLVGVSGWTKKNAPDAGPLERLNEFDPQQFITTEPLSGDPFVVMTQRQKERSYADAETEITTDGDVTKATLLEVLENTSKIALMMTPLAMVMPEVAIGLEVFYAAAGAVEAGVGADDLKHGKQGGADHIVFGVLNALPSVVHGASKLVTGAAEGEVVAANAAEELSPPSREIPEKPVDIKPRAEENVANRLRPSQAADISAYAIPDGERVIEGLQANAKGMHQLKDASGVDRWFIRYTDATGMPKVYEIRSDFKLRDDYVQIIDPQTRKPVMTVHSTGDGEWAPGIGPGGAREWPWKKKIPAPTQDEVLNKVPSVSSQFVEVDGTQMAGAKIFDKYVNADTKTNFTFSSEHYEQGSEIKRRLKIDWAANDGVYSVSDSERAIPSEFGAGEYAPNFIKDLHRSPYTLRVGANEIEMDFNKLKASFENPPANLEDSFLRDNLAKFEQAVPDPELRARISEVAHQGAAASTWQELGPPLLKDNYLTSAGDRHFLIDYNPAAGDADVTISAKWKLTDTDSAELEPIKDMDISSTRTFKIRKSSGAEGDRFKIEGPSNSRLQLSVG